ncbi:MAG TPA: ATP-binding protein [Nakamurella sp.]
MATAPTPVMPERDARARSFGHLALDRVRQDRGLGLITAAAMALFVVVVYALVVLGGGALLGRVGSPSLWLSVLATAIVAIAFEPARARINLFLARALHQAKATPYQTLADFPATVTGVYPAGQLPLRMATVLAEGTGAARAEVWLTVHGRMELAASWPEQLPPNAIDIAQCRAAVVPPALGADAADAPPTVVVVGSQHSLAVVERGELLGALMVEVREGRHLTPVEQRLFAGLAAQSGLMLRVAGLRAELEQQLRTLQRRTAELRRSRRDLVDRQDAERQRLERNIHDGAQQEVIALLVNLRLAQTLLTRSPERGTRLLAEQAAAARSTIATLTALSRGLYPRMLTDDGPVAALTAAVAAGPIPVELRADRVPRCAPDVEAAIYFSCLEAVQNATKHSGAARITIVISGRFRAGGVREIDLTVTDDGQGFDTTRRTGNGLFNMQDRIECVQGTVSVDSAPGRGTTMRARIPTAAGTLGSAPGSTGTIEDHRSPSGRAVVPMVSD